VVVVYQELRGVAMTEVELQLAMPDGMCDAVMFSPEPGKALPGVLHVPDIAGIRESHREMAKRLATEGYAVLLVNPFYRTGRPPIWDFPRVSGDPKTEQRMKELRTPLPPEAQMKDAAAYVDLLTALDGVRGPVGVVGYCFGGAMALRVAAAGGERVGAAASFHGGGLYKADDPASPHLLLPKVKARLYFGHAEGDKSMTAEQIAGLDEALEKWGGRYESETYAGARHGWTVPDNGAYKEAQAERAFGKMTELFAEALG
jgi:carboxymethylenebutenolidase